jgi:hypothetical protein
VAVVEQQVEIEILAIHDDAFLALHESEPHTQFEDEGLDLAENRRLQILFRMGVSSLMNDIELACLLLPRGKG